MNQVGSHIAHDIIDKFHHADRIEFDLTEQQIEPVKLAFEQNGYSVHASKEAPKHMVAIRVEADRTPQPNAR